MAVGEFFQVVLQGSYGGVEVNNVLNYEQMSAAVYPSDEEDIAQAWYGDAWANQKPLLSNFFQLDNIRVTNLSTLAVPFDFPVGEVGTNVTQGGPNQVSIITSYKTDKRGRSYRGRSFWCGLPEGNATASVVNAAALADWQSWAETKVVNLNLFGLTGLYDLQVYSRKLNEFNPVTTVIARGLVGINKSRAPKP